MTHPPIPDEVERAAKQRMTAFDDLPREWRDLLNELGGNPEETLFALQNGLPIRIAQAHLRMRI